MKPGTLQARLAAWYAAMITIVLVSYTAAVYVFAVDEPDEAAEPGAADVESTERALAQRQLLLVLGVGLVVSIAAAVGGGVVVTRRALAPLGRAIATFRELDIGDLSQRVDVDGRDTAEVRELADTLNATLARLERSVGALRRFTADASHELRTPLARIQGRLELAARRLDHPDVGAALEEVAELARLVESLLTLAHADAGDLVSLRSVVDVGRIVREAAVPYEAVAAERGIALDVAGGEPCLARGDEAALRRVVINLVDNACKFTGNGGHVRIGVRREGDRVIVVVADTGPGILPSDATHLGERFFRAERTRAVPGVGLGLAVSRDIARAHDGDVRLLPSTEGASFLLDLPACDDEGRPP